VRGIHAPGIVQGDVVPAQVIRQNEEDVEPILMISSRKSLFAAISAQSNSIRCSLLLTGRSRKINAAARARMQAPRIIFLVFIFTAAIIAANTQLSEVSVCWGSLGSVLRKE